MQRPSIAAATAPSSRLDGLDILRMFACLAVVLFHADIDILGGGTPVLEFGLWGVHVFMVLSGYLLTRPFLEGGRGRLELRSYFVKRLVRIVPAYYAVVFLAAGLILLGFGGERHVSSSVPMWWHVTSHLTFLHGWFAETKMSLLSALWSMSLEWQYYLVLPLLLWALRKVPVAALLFLVVALSLGFRAFICHGPLPGNEHLLAGFFLGRVPEFLLGMTLAALLGGHERRALHWMLGASAASKARCWAAVSRRRQWRVGL